MTRRVVIIGSGQMAELFCSQFSQWTDYRVAGFAIDRRFIREQTLRGLPVVPLDELEARFPPEATDAFVAIGPTGNNAVRAAAFDDLRRRGYRLPTLISPHAVVAADAVIGENVVIGHLTVISSLCRVGDNVVVGSTCNVGHHCQLQAHAFLAGHAVLAGSVVVGERAFVGAGAVIRDNLAIGAGSIVGAGAVILDNVEPDSVHVAERARRLPIPAGQVRL
jgi:sugar O-acyltransferase (sialic acid O-acetyltransferase NeuD family)